MAMKYWLAQRWFLGSACDIRGRMQLENIPSVKVISMSPQQTDIFWNSEAQIVLCVHLYYSSANTWLLFCCSFKFKSLTALFKLSYLNSELFSYWVDDNGIKWFSVFFNPLLFIYSWRGKDKNPDRDRNPLNNWEFMAASKFSLMREVPYHWRQLECVMISILEGYPGCQVFHWGNEKRIT